MVSLVYIMGVEASYDTLSYMFTKARSCEITILAGYLLVNACWFSLIIVHLFCAWGHQSIRVYLHLHLFISEDM